MGWDGQILWVVVNKPLQEFVCGKIVHEITFALTWNGRCWGWAGRGGVGLD